MYQCPRLWISLRQNRRIPDQGAAVTIAQGRDLAHDVLPEPRDVRRVRPVAHQQLPLVSFAFSVKLTDVADPNEMSLKSMRSG
jgi:hypothetical protein